MLKRDRVPVLIKKHFGWIGEFKSDLEIHSYVNMDFCSLSDGTAIYHLNKT